ncbi:MAG: DUF2071 domain-containing protein [Proteobacteria bacterium]|nr:DUF2071 domain-containing protein [Pseudomonadota bacterium]
MDIYDVLYLSWLIPQKRLRSFIPADIPFASKYEDKTIISLVIFQSKNVTSSLFPFLHFSYNQANIRTYIVDPVTGMSAVYFLKSGITSQFISFVTGLLKIPWQSISMNLDARYGDDYPYQYQVDGNWGGNFKIELKEDRNPSNPVPFQSIKEAALFLTGPAVGFYGTPGRLIRFEVNHSPIKPLTGKLSTMQCSILVNSGLIKEKELMAPQSALMAPYGRFTVFMPPGMISI